jgi:hypothetical protein
MSSPPPLKPKTFQASIRIEVALAERADHLVRHLAAARPDLGAFTVSRAALLRLAMQRGIAALESELPPPPTTPLGRKRGRKA